MVSERIETNLRVNNMTGKKSTDLKNEHGFINGNFSKNPKTGQQHLKMPRSIPAFFVISMLFGAGAIIVLADVETTYSPIKVDGKVNDWNEMITIGGYDYGHLQHGSNLFFSTEYQDAQFIYFGNNDTTGIKVFNFYADYKVYFNRTGQLFQNFDGAFVKTWQLDIARGDVTETKIKQLYLGHAIENLTYIVQTGDNFFSGNFELDYTEIGGDGINDTNTAIIIDGIFTDWYGVLSQRNFAADNYVNVLKQYNSENNSYIYFDTDEVLFASEFDYRDGQGAPGIGGVGSGDHGGTYHSNVSYDYKSPAGTMNIYHDNKRYFIDFRDGNSIDYSNGILFAKNKNQIEMQLPELFGNNYQIYIGAAQVVNTYQSLIFGQLSNKQLNDVGTRGITNITNLNGSAITIDGIITNGTTNDWYDADVFITNTTPNFAIYITHDETDTFIGIISLNNTVIDTEEFTLYFNIENDIHNSTDTNDYKFSVNSTNATLDKIGNSTGSWINTETYFNASVATTLGNVSAEFQINSNYICNVTNRTEGGQYNFGIEMKYEAATTQYLYYPSNNSGTIADIEFDSNSSMWSDNNFWSERDTLYGGIPKGTIINYLLSSVITFDGQVTAAEYSDTLEYTFGSSWPIKLYMKHDGTYTYIGVIATTDTTNEIDASDSCDIHLDWMDSDTLTTTDKRYRTAVDSSGEFDKKERGVFLPLGWTTSGVSWVGSEDILEGMTSGKRTYEFTIKNSEFISGTDFGIGIAVADYNSGSRHYTYSDGTELTTVHPTYRVTPSVWNDGQHNPGVIPEFEDIIIPIFGMMFIMIPIIKKHNKAEVHKNKLQSEQEELA